MTQVVGSHLGQLLDFLIVLGLEHAVNHGEHVEVKMGSDLIFEIVEFDFFEIELRVVGSNLEVFHMDQDLIELVIGLIDL